MAKKVKDMVTAQDIKSAPAKTSSKKAKPKKKSK